MDVSERRPPLRRQIEAIETGTAGEHFVEFDLDRAFNLGVTMAKSVG
jgi:hypothetical protein